MPVPPAELSAELTVDGPDAAREAALKAAGATAHAHEAGPGAVGLAGPRDEVLAALTETVTAALEAGAHEIGVRLEARD